MISLYYLIFFFISFFAALADFLFYKIPNTLILILIGGAVLKFLLEYAHTDFYLISVIFLTVFVLSYTLYRFKAMGAGDAKFLSVSVLWVSPQDFIFYLFVVTISGGLLAFAYIFLHKKIDVLRIKLIKSLKNHLFMSQYLKDPFIPAKSGSGEGISALWLPYGLPVFIGGLGLLLLHCTPGGLR